MHHSDGEDFDLGSFGIADIKGNTRSDLFQSDSGNTRIRVLGKAIGDAFAKVLRHVGFGIHGDITESAERTEVVQAPHMVVMLMGDQDRINRLEIVQTVHLLPEIGTTIHQDTNAVYFNQTGTTQAVVPRILARTNRTSATDFGYTC